MSDTEKVVVNVGDVWVKDGVAVWVHRWRDDYDRWHGTDLTVSYDGYWDSDWFRDARRIWPTDEGEVVAEGVVEEEQLDPPVTARFIITINGKPLYALLGEQHMGKNIVVMVKEVG